MWVRAYKYGKKVVFDHIVLRMESDSVSLATTVIDEISVKGTESRIYGKITGPGMSFSLFHRPATTSVLHIRMDVAGIQMFIRKPITYFHVKASMRHINRAFGFIWS